MCALIELKCSTQVSLTLCIKIYLNIFMDSIFEDVSSSHPYPSPFGLDSLANPLHLLPSPSNLEDDTVKITNNNGSYQSPQLNDGQQGDNSDAAGEKTEEIKRVSNTIFKTGLSQFKKALLEVVKNSKKERIKYVKQLILEVIAREYKQKNMSTFLKLLVIADQLKIKKKLLQIWQKRSSVLMKMKTIRNQHNKYRTERLEQLKKNIDNMTICLQESDIEKSLECYWGKHRHIQKYQNCKKDVRQFKQALEEEYSQKIGEYENHGYQLGKKKTKMTKKLDIDRRNFETYSDSSNS